MMRACKDDDDACKDDQSIDTIDSIDSIASHTLGDELHLGRIEGIVRWDDDVHLEYASCIQKD